MASLILSNGLRPRLMAAACLALVGGMVSCKRAGAPAGEAATPSLAATPAATPAAAVAAAVPAEVQKMLGRWLRSDGTYVLELRGADPSGVVQAGYFNPKPIHVSRAIWMLSPEGLRIIVELTDEGYPGATYVLSHDAKSDTLLGKYHQPQLGQTFDIDFVRQAKQP